MVIDTNDFVLGTGYNGGGVAGGPGNLGIGNTTNTNIFTQASGPNNQADFLIGSGGISATFARGATWIVRSGLVFATGSNVTGELGVGTSGPGTDRQTFGATLTLSNITQITASSGAQNQGCSVAAIRNDGTLYTWGNNGQGQLATGTLATQTSPTIPPGASGIPFLKVRFSGAPNQFGGTAPNQLGGIRIYALSQAGQMYLAGAAGRGFGTGVVIFGTGQTSFLQPIQNGLVFDDFSLFGGSPTTQSTIAKTPDGTLYAWGNNTDFAIGQPMGSGAAQAVLVPHKVPFQ